MTIAHEEARAKNANTHTHTSTTTHTRARARTHTHTHTRARARAHTHTLIYSQKRTTPHHTHRTTHPYPELAACPSAHAALGQVSREYSTCTLRAVQLTQKILSECGGEGLKLDSSKLKWKVSAA